MNNEFTYTGTGQLPLHAPAKNHNITFHNEGKEIGKLDFNGHEMVFTGDAEESAKVFIDWIARSFAGRLEDERKAEREACAKLIESHGPFLANGAMLAEAIRKRGQA
jgi:hypothetical protein